MSDPIRVTVDMTEDDLHEAVRLWLEGRGFATSDRFSVSVRTIPGDRPFDGETTDITVTGVFAKVAK